MAKKRPERQETIDDLIEVEMAARDEDSPIRVGSPGRSPSGAPRAHYIDPTVPLPGGVDIKPVKDQRVPVKRAEVSARKNLAREYLRNLIAKGGDTVAALALTYGMGWEEAYEQQSELHEELVASLGKSDGWQDILRRNDLTKESRALILRSLLYSGDKAAQVFALKLLQDIDSAKNNAGGGPETFEDWAFMAMNDA